MIPSYLTEDELQFIITRAIEEDLGDGDHTTLAVIPHDKTADAYIICKSEGTIAGTELAERIFLRFNDKIRVHVPLPDGSMVNFGDRVIKVNGNARAILSAERLVLNFMQRMSGIATATRRMSILLEGTGTHLLDTRKTSPLLRQRKATELSALSAHRGLRLTRQAWAIFFR